MAACNTSAAAGPATLPMRRSGEACPILGSVVKIPEGVRFIRVGIYDPGDVQTLRRHPGRSVDHTGEVALVIDCLTPERARAMIAASLASSWDDAAGETLSS